MTNRRDYQNYSGDQDDTQLYGDAFWDQTTGGDYTQAYYNQQDYYDQSDYYEPDYPQTENLDYDDYTFGAQKGMSMAARAAGRKSVDPYRRGTVGRQSNSRTEQRTRRRKKRRGLRKLFLVLLTLAGILVGLYFLLFRAPTKTQDGVHTRKSGFYNILLCATDEGELRTDTIMLATLDEVNGTIALTSLPRDTIVSNGQSVPKLNGVYAIAGGGETGAEALLDEVEKLLGFRPDGYVIVNYDMFKDAVDAMGGVVFDVPMDMTVDNANDASDILEISAGEQLLDGTMALGVCRYRYGYLMADIQRQYVQQSFLKAMIQQLISPSKITKLPGVYQAVMDNVITDLSGANLRYLALHVLLAGTDDIVQNTLPGEGVTYNGASCYGLYGQSVVDLVNEVMNPYEEDLTIDDVYILTVSGGTLVESTWTGVAFDASTYDYN